MADIVRAEGQRSSRNIMSSPEDGSRQIGVIEEYAISRIGNRRSDPHRHHDVAVLVVLALGGAQLAGGLGVFEFELHVAGADGLQEVQDVLGVEADGERCRRRSRFRANLPTRRFRWTKPRASARPFPA